MIRKKASAGPAPIPILSPGDPGFDTAQKAPFEMYPKQLEAFLRDEHEVFYGGAKFGGKSRGGQFFLLKGNTHRPACPAARGGGECNCCPPERNPDGSVNKFNFMVNRSYIYHPKYLACVIRKNVIDLRDWIREAEAMFRTVGGEFKEGKGQFDFPSGAAIYCGHYEDETTWMKYQGQNIVRFVLEELTQIPDVQRLKMLRSCCRSVYPEMRAQMFLTSNPGGVGAGWVFDRYIEPLDENGNIIPPGTTITEYFNADEIFERFGVPRPAGIPERLTSTRVFIQSSIKDNPAALVNPDYLAALADMDEDMREAYLYGNWKALSGSFFKQFRPNGPMRGEPPEANHVITYEQAKRDIKPWWWATAAMDWGYTHECAFLIGRHNQATGQFIITDELVVSETEPDVVGEEIARRMKPILAGLESPSIVMGLSHDAYGLRQDDRSIAELIAIGMGRILGRHMVHLPDLMVDELRDRITEEERANRPSAVEADKIFERIRNQQRMGVTIKRMRDNRVPGWQLVRSMLRWKQTLPEIKDIYDANLASRIAFERGLEDYQAYVKLFEQRREILPKLLIVGTPKGREGEGIGCQRVIQALPKALRSKLNPEDCDKSHQEGVSDVIDACFVGDTLIVTDHGQVPIKDIEVGDLVLTSKGFRSVMDSAQTGEGLVYQMEFEDGELVGTGNHPIWVEGYGWKPLSALARGDILRTCQEHPNQTQRLYSTRESSIIERPAQRGPCAENTSCLAIGMETFGSIVSFGKRLTDAFLAAFTYTTRTASQLTTGWKTWSASPPAFTNRGTCWSRIVKLCQPRWLENITIYPKRGKFLQRAWSFIKSSASITASCGLTVSHAGHIPAISAGLNFIPDSLAPQNTALKPAKAKQVTTSRTAVVKPPTPSGRAKVYNLTVADAEEYFANGVLVHNCRYLCMTFKSQSMPEPFASKVERRVSEVRSVRPDADCSDLIWLNRKLESENRDKAPKRINVIRSGRRARAVAKGLLPAPNSGN